MAEDRAIDATSTVEKPLKITLLGSGWSSSKGGWSTLNRELAIQLSEHAKADVSLLVPEGACEFQEIIEASSFGITVVEAKGRTAYDRLEWLSTPPKDHNMEIVVGHGVKLGRQVQFIRDSARFPNCKWVQLVHTAPEDLGRFKSYTEPISKGQRKHHDEVELCKLADLVVPVGPILKNVYSSYLRRHKTDQDVFTVTPGLFDREFEDLVKKQYPNEDGEFKVLLFGRGDDEDFELEGYNIAAQAFSDPRMKKDFCLMFVGVPLGKEDEVTRRLVQYGIGKEQLFVRTFIANREGIKDILCQADLVIMPSKSVGFGLVGLEALSAGLPILVSSRSGFAKALERVPSGQSCIVYSGDPTMWADAILAVRDRHKSRLDEIKALRESYGQIYSWRRQCEDLVKVMQKMILGYSYTDLDMTEKDKHNSDTERRMHQGRVYEPCQRPMKLRSHQKSESDDGVTTRRDPDQRSGKTSGRIPMLTSRKGTSAITILLRISAQDLDFQQQEIFYDSMQHTLLLTDCLMSDELGLFTGYFTEYFKARVFVQEVTNRGVEIKIECPNMESLASILNHHQCRRLDKLVERCFVTDAIKSVLNLKKVTLKTVLEDKSRYTEMLGELPEKLIFRDLRRMQLEAWEKTSKTELSVNLKRMAFENGLVIADNQGKGNCMFFALSEQLDHVKGIKFSQSQLRRTIVQYLMDNPTLPDGTQLFHFVDGYSSWNAYLTSMMADGTWGDHMILHAAANCFATCIRVISSLPHHDDVMICPEYDVTGGNRLVLGHVHELHYVSLISSKRDPANNPPEVSLPLLKTEDLPKTGVPWDDGRLPTDILLLTVEDCEFLGCLSYLNSSFCRSYCKELGYVYFGELGRGEMKVKMAVMKCYKGSITAGGSAVSVSSAVRVLRPKAVFLVGICRSLKSSEVKLGDVAISEKLITCVPSSDEVGDKVPLKSLPLKLIPNAGDGWKAPLKDPKALEVKIHRGDLLSVPGVIDNNECRETLIKRFPHAIAMELEGQGLYAAAHALDVPWIIIKGISDYADCRKSGTDRWRSFASLMAASLTAHILSDPVVFQDWPHYKETH